MRPARRKDPIDERRAGMPLRIDGRNAAASPPALSSSSSSVSRDARTATALARMRSASMLDLVPNADDAEGENSSADTLSVREPWKDWLAHFGDRPEPVAPDCGESGNPPSTFFGDGKISKRDLLPPVDANFKGTKVALLCTEAASAFKSIVVFCRGKDRMERMPGVSCEAAWSAAEAAVLAALRVSDEETPRR